MDKIFWRKSGGHTLSPEHSQMCMYLSGEFIHSSILSNHFTITYTYTIKRTHIQTMHSSKHTNTVEHILIHTHAQCDPADLDHCIQAVYKSQWLLTTCYHFLQHTCSSMCRCNNISHGLCSGSQWQRCLHLLSAVLH